MSSRLSLSNIIRASEQASHTWKHEGKVCIITQGREDLLLPSETVLPSLSDRSRKITVSVPLIGDRRREENSLENASPHFLRLTGNFPLSHKIQRIWIPRYRKVYGQLRYHAKSDKGGTCIRRKALYLMLQMWSQAPKPTKERIHT